MPGPGYYDNFKTFEDKGKKRACTMGKRYLVKSSKNVHSPGPGNYNTSHAARYADNGGVG